MTSLPAGKRQRREHMVDQEAIFLSEPGEDAFLPLVSKGVVQEEVVRHGSSLDLISKCHAIINDEFNETDPEEDFKKWQALGAGVYFLCVLDPASSITSCVLRVILDGLFSAASSPSQAATTTARADGASPLCQRRLIIDYVATVEEMRGRGLASHLIQLVKSLAERHQANLYVLALEDSCVYFMNKGFILEESEIVQERLNVFPDTHLLKLPSNRPEDPASFTRIEPEVAKEAAVEEPGCEASKQGNGSGSSAGTKEDGEGEDELQLAILASLGEGTQPPAAAASDPQNRKEEPAPHHPLHPPPPPPKPKPKPCSEGATVIDVDAAVAAAASAPETPASQVPQRHQSSSSVVDEEVDEDLALAIALSMSDAASSATTS